MVVYFVHRGYPLGMEKRVEFVVRDEYLYPAKKISTPSIRPDGVDLSLGFSLSSGIPHLPHYSLIEDSRLFDRLINQYLHNIYMADCIDLPTGDNGGVTDFGWLDSAPERILLGGCFLDGCLRNGIRSIQEELFRRGERRELVIIPQLTINWCQPSEILFAENVKDIQETKFIPSSFWISFQGDIEDDIPVSPVVVGDLEGRAI
jgi:hypothetical protein